jgi:hypothetical protein
MMCRNCCAAADFKHSAVCFDSLDGKLPHLHANDGGCLCVCSLCEADNKCICPECNGTCAYGDPHPPRGHDGCEYPVSCTCQHARIEDYPS